MEENLERMARALWPQVWMEIDRNRNPTACEQIRRQELSRARRGLRAIREPSNAMCDAGIAVTHDPIRHSDEEADRAVMAEQWRAMIDCLLNA